MRSIINNNTVNTVDVSSVSLISKSDVGLSQTPSLVEQSCVGTSLLEASLPSPTRVPSQEGGSAL